MHLSTILDQVDMGSIALLAFLSFPKPFDQPDAISGKSKGK